MRAIDGVWAASNVRLGGGSIVSGVNNVIVNLLISPLILLAGSSLNLFFNMLFLASISRDTLAVVLIAQPP